MRIVIYRLETMPGQEINLKEKKLIEILEDPTRKQFIQEILVKKSIEFIELYTKLKVPETTARHHIKQLEESEIIEKFKEKGTRSLKVKINPVFITLIRKALNIKREFCYYGMVGIDNEGEGFLDVEKRFDAQNIHFKKFFLGMTVGDNERETKESNSWKKLLSEYEIEFKTTQLNDFEIISKDLEELLLNIIDDYEPIINITRGTKIHTIVLYRLGQKYSLKSFYLPEKEDKIILLP